MTKSTTTTSVAVATKERMGEDGTSVAVAIEEERMGITNDPRVGIAPQRECRAPHHDATAHRQRSRCNRRPPKKGSIEHQNSTPPTSTGSRPLEMVRPLFNCPSYSHASGIKCTSTGGQTSSIASAVAFSLSAAVAVPSSQRSPITPIITTLQPYPASAEAVTPKDK